MPSFALKQNQVPKPVASSPARPKLAWPELDYREHAILHLQRALGNQAVQRMLQADAEEVDAGLTSKASPHVGHDVSRIPLLEHMPSASVPGDPLEREADDVADKVMRITEPPSTGLSPFAFPRKRIEAGDQERKVAQTKHAPSANLGAALNPVAAVRATEQGGAPLSKEARSYFEVRFGHDFSGVLVHADSEAANAASAVQARAYTIGRHIVFGSDEYAPGTMRGKQLLAHELAHIVQQRERPVRGLVMRQPAGLQRAPMRPATVEEAAEFLEDMARFIEGARSLALAEVNSTPRTPTTPAARQRAHRMVNQRQLRNLLANARTTFAVQERALQGGDPHGTRLRAALLGVVVKIREVALDALRISDGMPPPTPDDERRLNAELVVELIETDPFTSAGMAGTPAFGAAESGVGVSHEAFIEAYLDDLIRTLPGQTLAPADRDRILGRISAALRRAFLTVGTGPAGTPDVRAIANPTIVDKYRRVTELLSAGMTAQPTQLSIITDALPAYVLPPDPVPDVTPQLQTSPNIGTVELSFVPESERAYVRYGVLQAANTVFGAGSTVQRRNASWPVALQVRRGGNIVRVRYDLIFDAASNVRVERLGEAAPREVAPAFAQLAVPDKKARLIADFNLAAVDDRPPAPGRPAAVWTGPELDQVKAAYDLIPDRDRPALRGVTIVRDHHGPPDPALPGSTLLGFAHLNADPGHDEPAPPPHAPPHIHYYDDAFDQNAITAVGAPGSTGPGADWTITHEVGHMRIFLATRGANAAMIAANQQAAQANQGLPAVNAGLPPALHQIRLAWSQARSAANAAIQALNAAVVATPPAGPAQRAQLLQAALAAIAARDMARANLAKAAVPQAMIQAATNLDAASDAVFAATQSIGVSEDQIPTFVSLAGTFGFTPFTDYARRKGNDEWFAETYALYLTDPNRLNQMNRSIFLWFEAGMPMNPTWRPPP